MEAPEYTNGNVVEQPMLQPQRKSGIRRGQPRRQSLVKTNWDAVDRLPFIVAVVLLLVVTISVVGVKNQTAAAQQRLTATNEKVTTARNENNNLKQDIAALTSSDRLTKVANEFGLTLNLNNVRSVK